MEAPFCVPINLFMFLFYKQTHWKSDFEYKKMRFLASFFHREFFQYPLILMFASF